MPHNLAGSLRNLARERLAIYHRATLATFDGGFRRFPSLELDYLQ